MPFWKESGAEGVEIGVDESATSQRGGGEVRIVKTMDALNLNLTRRR